MLESESHPKPSKLFTRRHYIKIAQTLYDAKPESSSLLAEKRMWNYVVKSFNTMFITDNFSTFNPATFIHQCNNGVPPDETR